MISALNAAKSGMLANQRALEISAHNTANFSTSGFQPAQAEFSEQTSGGVQASSRVTLSETGKAASASGSASATATPAPSGTDLANEVVNSLTYKYGFEASAKMVKTADELLGTLIDIKA